MKRAALIAGVSFAALLVAVPMPVQAWPGDNSGWPGFSSRSAAPAPAKSSKARLKADKKPEPDHTPPIPPGPLHIIVSIDKQRATLFADGVPFASTAVSTGTASHPTPMGVFSIIQKSRHHVSNLYGAAMPYMQRITWSGAALHQGPLPGYPASHGCVRLTETFAQTLWKATKLGARVIITRPEVAPAEFEHPRLFVATPRMAEVPLPLPQPVTATTVAAAPAPPAPVVVASAIAIAPAPIVAAAEPATTSTATRIRTADAGSGSAVAVMSVVGDAAKAVVTSIETAPRDSASAEQPTKLTDAPTTEGKSAQAAEPPAAAETKIAEAAGEAKPVEATAERNAAEAVVEPKPADVAIEAKPAETVAEPKPAAAEAKPVEPRSQDIKPAIAQSEKSKPAAEAVPVTIAAPAPIIVDDRVRQPAAAEDRLSRLPPSHLQEVVTNRPISVFVSLKDGKLYVRQGWKPLFTAPVTVEQSDQPIGTHLYTAMNARADGTGFRWTVVSIPSGYRRYAELSSSGKSSKSRHDKPVKVVEVEGPPPSPIAALDRVVIAPETVARISELMTPGSSLIVSDNKLSDETGDYTDFIVLTR